MRGDPKLPTSFNWLHMLVQEVLLIAFTLSGHNVSNGHVFYRRLIKQSVLTLMNPSTINYFFVNRMLTTNP